MTTRVDEATVLSRAGLDWLLSVARPTGPGLAWPVVPSADEAVYSLYQGTTGVIPALLEGWRHFGDDRYGDAAVRAARTVASKVEEWDDCSLYNGLTGMAVVLRAVDGLLGDQVSAAAADRALEIVRSRFDGVRWGDPFELLFGNAGIAVGALQCGDVDLAVMAVEPYVRTALATPHGVNWEMRTGVRSRYHHFAHGTLGVAYALAAVGHAASRCDLVDLATVGASDVVARNEAGPRGFSAPHSDPQRDPDRERISYGWCNGSTGDALTFRMLAQVTRDPRWTSLVDRCWRTVTGSGLPMRLRPGFWDNSGRCCGTAGVLAFACDRIIDSDDGWGFADVLVADLADRAIVDAAGARWSNHEHRDDPSDLEPHAGWAMGNSGIVRELLRYSRTVSGSSPAYVAALPDHPAPVPFPR